MMARLFPEEGEAELGHHHRLRALHSVGSACRLKLHQGRREVKGRKFR
jgi:hypothetical protein